MTKSRHLNKCNKRHAPRSRYPPPQALLHRIQELGWHNGGKIAPSPFVCLCKRPKWWWWHMWSLMDSAPLSWRYPVVHLYCWRYQCARRYPADTRLPPRGQEFHRSLQNTHQSVIMVFRPNLAQSTNHLLMWKQIIDTIIILSSL